MKETRNTVGELIKQSKVAKNPSKEWRDDKGSNAVPNEEHNSIMFSNSTAFPSNFGVDNIGEKSRNDVGNSTNKPETIVTLENYTSKKSVKAKIKDSKKGASNGKTTGFLRRIGMLFFFGFVGLFRVFGFFNHMYIISLFFIARSGQNASFLI